MTVDRVGVRYDLRLLRQQTLRAALLRLPRRDARSHSSVFWALEDVSFALNTGEVLGIVGRNGSGKSTLLLAIAGILRPQRGVIRTFGRTARLLTLGAGFERELTGRENIYLNGAFLGLPRREIARREDEIVEFSELGDFIDVPIRQYSTGMRARLGFAIAVHVNPDILLLDEVLLVGDHGFRIRSQEKIAELAAKATAVVIVSHAMGVLRESCNRALWLHEGRVAALGDVEPVVSQYLEASAERGPVRTVPK